MSLAWGTGLMAAEFATEHQARQAAVIGCGSVGLTCARQLQRRGFDVTIYAMAVPPYVTSNMSLAGFTPALGPGRKRSADAGVGRAVPARRGHLLPPAAAARRPALRRVVAGQLFARRTSCRQPQPSNPERPSLNAGLHVGQEVLRAGRASVPDQVRDRLAADPHRAVDLPRQPGARFPALGRPDRHPQVRHAARAGVAARADRRQLHRPRRQGSLRRSGARAAQRTADGDGAAARGELPHQRRRAAGAGRAASAST